MKAIIILGLLLIVANAVVKPQFEFGIDQSLHWAAIPYHILQESSSVPRSYSATVRFTKPFFLTPVVVLAPIKLDWLDGLPQGFDITATDINKAGFTIKYSALTPLPVSGFDLSWAAIQDSNIFTYEFQTNKDDDIGKLKTNTGTARANLQFKFPENWTLKSTPNVAVFLTGVLMATKYVSVEVKLLDTLTTKTDFSVQISALKGVSVSYVRFNAIIGVPETLYVGSFGFNWKTGSKERQTDPEAERYESLTADITDEKFHKFPRYPLYGVSQYYYNHSGNMRLACKNFQLVKGKVNVDCGTWQNSEILSATFNYFIYIPLPDATMSDPDCAQVFEQCDYKGDSFLVCDRKMSFPKDGWNKPVKSFKVPEDKILKLYNQEDLLGKSIRIEKDTPCVEEVKFNFIQLANNSDFWEND